MVCANSLASNNIMCGMLKDRGDGGTSARRLVDADLLVSTVELRGAARPIDIAD
jgi:hypothetical protein